MPGREGRLAIKVLLVTVVLYLAVFYGMRDAYNKSRPWLGAVVKPAEVDAARWMGEHLPENTIVNGDIFGGEMYMAVAGVRNGVGGDWFLVNESDKWMWDCQHIFTTHDAKNAWELAKKRQMAYIVVPPNDRSIHCGFGWKSHCPSSKEGEECVDRNKFSDPQFFRRVYARDGVEIYRVIGVDEDAWPFREGRDLVPWFIVPGEGSDQI